MRQVDGRRVVGPAMRQFCSGARVRRMIPWLGYGWRRAGWVLMLAVVLAALAVADATTAQSAPPLRGSDVWRSLGPTGRYQAGEIGVSSDWPADPFVIAELEPSMTTRWRLAWSGPSAARTFDGGQSWEPLPNGLPAGPFTVLRLADGQRVLLAVPNGRVGATGQGYIEKAAYRSTDDGATWAPVLALAGTSTVKLVASPSVRDVRRAYILDDGKLYETQDAGATWTTVEPAPGLQISSVQFSNAFSTDRTIFVSVATAPIIGSAAFRSDRLPLPSGDGPGVLVSIDAGQSWAPLSNGLEVDGAPYRDIRSLAISPTFDRDGTLFAFSWHVADRQVVFALFRSRTRGQDWEIAWRSPVPTSGTTSWMRMDVLMSPRFADDGLVAVVAGSGNIGPHAGCQIRLSTDGGQTWTKQETHLDGSCVPPVFYPGFGADPPAVVWNKWSGGSWGWSGTPFESTSGVAYKPPGVWGGSPQRFSFMTVARDGTLFIGAPGGVWTRGPSAVRAHGRFPCPVDDSPTVATALGAAAILQPWLGCPTEAPRSVAVRERRLADTRDLWLEDDGDAWLSLREASLAGDDRRDESLVTWLSKADRPWTGQADQTLMGELHRYDGGLLLRLPRPEGGWSTLVVTDAYWLEHADP